ncbi:hypothetical protein EZV61_17450 [Corallincola luteus]|uniref:DUF3313 domain-containing protein n=1 Tax=Corallincola luteus TaxID=1775177 RepID=A0ABY2AGP5_9GAMM|nr:hypothetical protein [Corallincola luteus]TCI01504.1 hypothetical protein EZV61_17450 [Corallincola luteus]
MKWVPKHCLVALLTLLFAAGCAQQQTSVRTHPDFANNRVNIERIAVVPPIVEFHTVEFSGEGVRNLEQEARFEKLLIERAVLALQNRGYTPVVVDREEVSHELANFNVDLGKLRQQYQQASERLYKQHHVSFEESVSFQESVGEAASIVASYADADAVLLMRYSGFEKTGGALAKDVAVSVLVGLLTGYVPVQEAEGEFIEVAVLDGVTGNVLWVNAASKAQANNSALSEAFTALQDDIDTLPSEAPTMVNAELTEADVNLVEESSETEEISL